MSHRKRLASRDEATIPAKNLRDSKPPPAACRADLVPDKFRTFVTLESPEVSPQKTFIYMMHDLYARGVESKIAWSISLGSRARR